MDAFALGFGASTCGDSRYLCGSIRSTGSGVWFGYDARGEEVEQRPHRVRILSTVSQMMPPQLAAMLQQGGGGQGDQETTDPLQALQDVIGETHALMIHLTDPADVDAVAGALRVLTQVQRRLMSEQSGPAQTPAR